jgi:hypothetical protein
MDNQVFMSLKTQVFSSGQLWQPICLVENKSTSPHTIVRFLERNQQPMLSAVSKEEPLDMSNTDQAASFPAGFGKMLNSLQGLQQRLEDFSIADVTNAEANARALILRLKQFQDTVGAIALLKNAAASINQSITGTQQLDTDVVGMDNLENHPQLHAIVKATKLIKLQKVMAALKAGAQVGELHEEPNPDLASSTLTSMEQSSKFPSETSEIARPEPVDYELPGRQEPAIEAAPNLQEPEPVQLNAATIDSLSDLETAADSKITAITASDTGTLDIDALADFPTAEAEFETAIAAAAIDSVIDEGALPDFPASAEKLTDSQTPARPSRVEVATSLPQPVKRKQDSQSARVKKSKARNNEPGEVDPSKALVPANESFDLRLLDDLVSNYGEFASNPNLPATVKKKELQSFEPAANETHQAALGLSPVEVAAPVAKKHGDLDRQLKKIIKDYGEYDIYSDKQTTNIKKAGILAFVFLGLIFGGIYFFKTPPSTAKAAPAASNSTSATPDDRKSRAGATESAGDSRETAPGAAHEKEKPTATN